MMIVIRPALYLISAFIFLLGLMSLYSANAGGDATANMVVPFNLFGAGVVLLGVGLLPPRWKGEPRRGEIDIDGTPAAALVFPFMRRPLIAWTGALTLLALAAMYGLAAALIVGGLAQVAGAAIFVALLTWGAVAAIRTLRSPKHVALTPESLSFRAPGGRLDVQWVDIEEIGLVVRGMRFRCWIELRAGAPVPFRDGDVLKTYRVVGADVLELSWLTCHPRRVFTEMESFLERAAPTR
ncbi:MULTISPECIES: hypothetical protein [unclassified Spirillospora]|uniref:hypothetical protein n=1 Tax=unclassified Spirillospora TaxID=2642701 RepID=UPI00371870D3